MMTDSEFDRACDEHGLMTSAQYQEIAALLRIRDSRARAAARLVLVDGVKQVHAAIKSGSSPSNVSQIVRTIRRGMVLANEAIGQRNA